MHEYNSARRFQRILCVQMVSPVRCGTPVIKIEREHQDQLRVSQESLKMDTATELPSPSPMTPRHE